MSKSIVILNGSPRPGGVTAALIKAFTDGAKAAGSEVTEFFLSGMNINCCRGCFGGRSEKEYPCTQRDDMEKIYPAVRKAEVIVFASPLYYWGLSGQTVTALNRLFALEEGESNTLRGHGRGSVLLMAAGSHGFDDAVSYFAAMNKNPGWQNMGSVLCGDNKRGTAVSEEKLKEAYELGKSL